MSMEAALVESRTLRSSMCERVEALDKVKVLIFLPDGLHVTTRMVAEYFEVGERAINAVIHRHREELEGNGFTVLKAVDNSVVQSCNLKLSQVSGRGLAVFNRRAVLNVAMLLRDSEVARQVRSEILNTVEAAWSQQPQPQPAEPQYYPARPWKSRSELRWDEYEATSRDAGAEAWRRKIDGQEPFESYKSYEPYRSYESHQSHQSHESYESAPAPTVTPTDERLGSIERRLVAQGEVIMAIGHRLCRYGDDLGAIRRDVGWLRGRRRS